MKRLILVAIFAALAWAGWWFWQAHALRGQVETWFSERQAAGWVATYGDLSIAGFPNRLDITLTDLTLADPRANLLWEAPLFQILGLSYQNDHKILIFPDTQTLSITGSAQEISSEGLRASVVFAEDQIARLNVEAQVINWEGGALANMTAALLHQEDLRYQFAFLAGSVARTQSGLTPLSEGRVDDLQINSQVTFDIPWSLSALQDARPQPTGVDLTLLAYQLDSLELNLAGDLTLDSKGRATGELTLRALNWQEALEQSRLQEHVSGGVVETLIQGLSVIAGLKGRSDTLDLPLGLKDGQMSLGLIPIGPAPTLQLP